MSNTPSSLSIPFVSEATLPHDKDNPSTWVRLEQEPIPTAETELTKNSLYQMLARVLHGGSAYDHLREVCPYASVSGERIFLKIPVLVWTSDIDSPYRIECDSGVVSSRFVNAQPHTFDLLFEDSAEEELDRLFTGNLLLEMPCFSPEGEPLDLVPEISGTYVYFSENVVTVVHGIGISTGYKHTVLYTVDKGISSEAAANTVRVFWEDDDGEEQIEEVELVLPACAKALVEACDETVPGGSTTEDEDDGEPIDGATVYYSTCNGEVIEVVPKENE